MEKTEELISKMGSEMLFISTEPDSIITGLIMWASKDMTKISSLFDTKRVRVNIFIKNNVSQFCSLIQHAKEEEKAIIKKINGMDIPYLSLAKSEDDADIVIAMRRGRCKVNGKSMIVLRIKWYKTSLTESYFQKINIVNEKYGQMNSLEALETQPVSVSAKAASILRVNGLMRACAYITILKTALSEAA